ncbi:MAG: phospholipid carrier-dependent glycosyltransferase [Novosphingobium sp.]|nr:phospholipid carrier-dependent glycosyltransferase [Novosphingobium sp.]MBO9601287.1 phospholipid carrier-dependent glycosyltransferase [Novosphingobium sp.]
MTQSLSTVRDPRGWSALIVAIFAVLVCIRLGTPSRFYFDEVHYIPAARVLLQFDHITNREHPLVGKEILALALTWFGDKPVAWRVFPVIAGILTLIAFIRLMWFTTLSRFATIAGGVLLATGFVLFVQARIAMLDIFMACFTMIGLWMVAAAVRLPGQARWRLAAAGIAMGLALGSKWNAAPLAVLPGLTFLVLRIREAGPRFLTRRDCGPIPGISLIEAGVWLGVLPVVVYLATFWPVFFYAKNPLTIGGYWEYHKKMYELQEQVVKPHPYMSRWYEWVIDWRPIWYLYERVDGAQRGVLLIGNPFTMIVGLAAVAWCGWAGFMERNRPALVFFGLYAVTIGMWIVAPKPVQFYYHYFLPSCFLLGALAVTLDQLWKEGWHKTALGSVIASVVLFAIFYPIISAAHLEGPYSFQHWMWLNSWK